MKQVYFKLTDSHKPFVGEFVIAMIEITGISPEVPPFLHPVILLWTGDKFIYPITNEDITKDVEQWAHLP